MALGALSLSVTQGVQGRPFQANIVGLTTGRVEVLGGDGSPGFSSVNGKVISTGLPYVVSTVVLREYEPGVGQGFRDSRIEIMAATPAQILLTALGAVGLGRLIKRFGVSVDRLPDGTTLFTVWVEDDLGATIRVGVGGGSLIPAVSSIIQDDITVFFAAPAPVLAYAGGGYATTGTVASTIPASTPGVDGTFSDGGTFAAANRSWIHGAEINPGTQSGNNLSPVPSQGFDALVDKPPLDNAAYTPPFNPALNVDPGRTGQGVTTPGVFRKTRGRISPTKFARDLIEQDLYVVQGLSALPPANSFMPWTGTTHLPVTADDMDMTVFPQLPAAGTLPTAASLITKLGPLALSINDGLANRSLMSVATSSSAGYGGNIAIDLARAILFCCVRDSEASPADKKLVATYLASNGLRMFQALEAGKRWSGADISNGGGQHWIKGLIVLCARLFRNTPIAAQLAVWADKSQRNVFAEDLMIFPIARRDIETTPFGAYLPAPLPYTDAMENSMGWNSKPSDRTAARWELNARYRVVVLGGDLGIGLATRLVNGARAAWNNPDREEYMDQAYNWTIAQNDFPLYVAYRDDLFVNPMMAAYWAGASAQYQNVAVPTLARAVGRTTGAYSAMWLEFDRPLDRGFFPADTAFTITRNGSPVTLTPPSAKTATTTTVNGTLTDVVALTNTTGLRVGMRFECSAFPPHTRIVAINGLNVQMSRAAISSGAGLATAFFYSNIYGRSVEVMLPAASNLAQGDTATIAYTQPGTNNLRTLSGASVPTIAATAITNRTGELAPAATTKDTVYGGATQASRQFSATSPLAISTTGLQRLTIGIRGIRKSAEVASDFFIGNATPSSVRLWLQMELSTTLRLFMQRAEGTNTIASFGNAFANCPLNQPVDIFIDLDYTQAAIADAVRLRVVWATDGNSRGATGTYAANGTFVSDNMLLNGLAVGAGTSGLNAANFAFKELILDYGTAAEIPRPADLTSGAFAYGSDWGDRGQNVWGRTPKQFYAAALADWNTGHPNRGTEPGALTLTPRRTTTVGEDVVVSPLYTAG